MDFYAQDASSEQEIRVHFSLNLAVHRLFSAVSRTLLHPLYRRRIAAGGFHQYSLALST